MHAWRLCCLACGKESASGRCAQPADARSELGVCVFMVFLALETDTFTANAMGSLWFAHNGSILDEAYFLLEDLQCQGAVVPTC